MYIYIYIYIYIYFYVYKNRNQKYIFVDNHRYILKQIESALISLGLS